MRKSIIDREKIIRERGDEISDPTVRHGIYFLVRDNCIIYVGQSIRIPDRVRNHPYQYDYYLSYEVDPEESLSDHEAEWIIHLNPQFNMNIPPNARYLSRLTTWRLMVKLGCQDVSSDRLWRKDGIAMNKRKLAIKMREIGVRPMVFLDAIYYPLEALQRCYGFDLFPLILNILNTKYEK